MSTFEAMAQRLERKAERVSSLASDAAVVVANTIQENLIRVTPVDTSEALSNWQVTLGSPATGNLPPYFAGSDGSTQGQSEQAAIAHNRDVLARKRPGESIFITNRLPYIRKLDGGSSTQTPANFVSRARLLGRLKLMDIKDRLNGR